MNEDVEVSINYSSDRSNTEKSVCALLLCIIRRKHLMKDTNTGDQSGGLFRRDGSSTPPWHNGHNMGEESSREIAEPTDDKNPQDARDVAASRVSDASTTRSTSGNGGKQI